MGYVQHHHNKGEVLTGLLYIEEDTDDMHANLNTVPVPLNRLGESELCPGSAKLSELNAEYR
jgi:2-oxoglutarate ferredoxin oxidoreductase subunit beta